MLYSVDDGIATITLNRPERMNAMGGTLTRDVRLRAKEAEEDPHVRAVIITGAGRGFCAGMDLKDRSQGKGARSWQQRLRGMEAPRTFLNMNTPTIAAVNGAAIGGGFELAMLCDYRIGSDRARMSDMHVKIGASADLAGFLTVPRVVGWANACKILLTGEIFEAQELLRMGILDEVVPHDELMDRARAFARRIACNAPLAVQMTKRLLRSANPIALDDVQDYSLLLTGAVQQTDDFREAVRAFADKRPPNFTGA